MVPSINNSFFCIGFVIGFDFQAVAKGLQGTVMIDLDGGGPIPPANLVCRLEEAGEPVKKKKT